MDYDEFEDQIVARYARFMEEGMPYEVAHLQFLDEYEAFGYGWVCEDYDPFRYHFDERYAADLRYAL